MTETAGTMEKRPMIYYRCKGCGATLETPAELRGKLDKCPDCGTVCVVPAVSSVQMQGEADPAVQAFVGALMLMFGAGMVGCGVAMRTYVLASIGAVFGIGGYIVRARFRRHSSSAEPTTKHCPHCDQLRPARRIKPDHLVHFSLALATLGAWVIVWLIASLQRGWRCEGCGKKIVQARRTAPRQPVPSTEASPQPSSGGFLGGFVYAMGFAVGLITMIQVTGGLDGLMGVPKTPSDPSPTVVETTSPTERDGQRPSRAGPGTGREARALEEVKAFIRRGGNINGNYSKGFTALHWAARHGYATVVAFLVEKGADVNGRESAVARATPLHVAATYNHMAVARLLLEKGADVSTTDRWGSTPLQYAAFNGHNDLIELFLSKGANIKHREKRYGITALHASVAGKKPKTLELLLSKGAETNARNHAGETALGTALRMSQADIAAVLRKHGARQ